jgi:glycosyltransferase involved in cell wall biosynthesis
MRVVQIIDSLEAGGAERMAVNYANALSEKIEFSGLVATRKEGLLKSQINPEVSYLFLDKKKSFDFKAALVLRKFIKQNKADVVHAHSSSFFIAVLVKLMLPGIKIIWHDHYGISQDLSIRRSFILKLCSCFFSGSIAVNTALKNWAETYLLNSDVIYLPNFVIAAPTAAEEIALKGNEGRRIACVANLRPQKNHKLLIEAAAILKGKHPEWTYHLFGKDFEDEYAQEIKLLIKRLLLDDTVFLYGSSDKVDAALQQCAIGVLPSSSEGLPLALLEYGLHQLPVIATKVGEVDKIITSEKEGVIIESGNTDQLISALDKVISDESYRATIAKTLHYKIKSEYSEQAIINKYIAWIVSLS